MEALRVVYVSEFIDLITRSVGFGRSDSDISKLHKFQNLKKFSARGKNVVYKSLSRYSKQSCLYLKVICFISPSVVVAEYFNLWYW